MGLTSCPSCGWRTGTLFVLGSTGVENTLVSLHICPRHYLTPLSQASFPFLKKTFSEFPQLLCQFQVHSAPHLWVRPGQSFPGPWSPRLHTIHSIIILIWPSFHRVPLMEIFSQPCYGDIHPKNHQTILYTIPQISANIFTCLVVVAN